jgi:alcohol dehydrogenase YqhD (iron-dependent ADH family)
LKNDLDKARLLTGRYVKEHGGTKVMIHYGGRSTEKSGLLERIKKSLSAEGLPYVLLGGVLPNPRSGLVYTGIDLCRKEGVDFILAAGGGSCIDSAKAIAMGAVYEGDFWDFYSGNAKVNRMLGVGVVLTIAAAGSETSFGSVLTNDASNLKRSCGTDPMIRPRFAIMNPELTFSVPPYQTACGIVDIFGHTLERYLTISPNVDLTDRLAEALMISVIKRAADVMERPCDYDARADIMWAGSLAQSDICLVGRKNDWAAHRLEHELSSLYGVAHGAGLAVLYPAYMTWALDYQPERFEKLAINVWGVSPSGDGKDTATSGIERMKGFFRSIGMPVTFSEIGARKEDIALLVNNVDYSASGTVGDFIPVGRKEAAEIFTIAAEQEA